MQETAIKAERSYEEVRARLEKAKELMLEAMQMIQADSAYASVKKTATLYLIDGMGACSDTECVIASAFGMQG